MNVQKLKGRTNLKINIPPQLKKSLDLRLQVASEMFDLQDCSVNLCCTVEKRTICREHLRKNSIYIDTNHFYTMNELIWLYYFHGKRDIKQIIYSTLYKAIQEPEIKYKMILKKIMIERKILDGNIDAAFQLSMLPDSWEYSSKDRNRLFVENFLIIAEMKTKNREVFNLTFYVFHEMAHVEYGLNEHRFKQYFLYMKKFNDANKGNDFYGIVEKMKDEEVCCDLHALILQYCYYRETIDEKDKKEYALQIIDAYIVTTANELLLRGLDIDSLCLFEREKVNTWFRIIACITLFKLYLSDNDGIDCILEIEILQNDLWKKFNNFYDKYIYEWVRMEKQLMKDTNSCCKSDEEKMDYILTYLSLYLQGEDQSKYK